MRTSSVIHSYNILKSSPEGEGFTPIPRSGNKDIAMFEEIFFDLKTSVNSICEECLPFLFGVPDDAHDSIIKELELEHDSCVKKINETINDLSD